MLVNLPCWRVQIRSAVRLLSRGPIARVSTSAERRRWWHEQVSRKLLDHETPALGSRYRF